MVPSRQCVFSAILSCGLFVGFGSHAETLRESLVAKGIELTGLESPNLDKPITSGIQFDATDVFLTAYYFDDGSGHINAPLLLEMLNKKTHKWAHKEINLSALDAGSIGGIVRTKNGYYLYAHMNPSAGTTIILSPSLEFRGTVLGWFLGDFADGSVAYANSMVHFAPTHPGRVSIYNPATKIDREIYPMKPYQAIRRAHISKVKAAYDKLGEEWFRTHNHHGDPELFSNYIDNDKAAANDATDSLVFIASYDNIETVADPDKNASSCRDSFMDVLYVYRKVHAEGKTEYREMLLDDVKKEFGDVPLLSLLEPKMLRTIFEVKK